MPTLTMAGGKLAAGMSKLAGHKEFAVSSDLSLLGRTVDIYMLNGEAVGSPVASAGEIYYTFADAQELKAVCDSNSFTFADSCSYYSNFEPATAGHPVQPAGKRKDHGHRPYRRPQVRRRAGHVRPHRDRRQHRSADHQSRHGANVPLSGTRRPMCLPPGERPQLRGARCHLLRADS